MSAARSSCSLLISGVSAGRVLLLLLPAPAPLLRFNGSKAMRPCFGAAGGAAGCVRLLDVAAGGGCCCAGAMLGCCAGMLDAWDCCTAELLATADGCGACSSSSSNPAKASGGVVQDNSSKTAGSA